MNVLVSCAPRLRCLILSGVLALACVHAWAAPSAEAALSGEDIYRRATEDVRGPSAGLAQTLRILDVRPPGSSPGGRDMAVTRTNDQTGRVGEVGGVGQKAVAASQEGAELLLVPTAEAPLAERFADADVEVVGVDDLDDALAALDDLGGNALDLADTGG